MNWIESIVLAYVDIVLAVFGYSIDSIYFQFLSTWP